MRIQFSTALPPPSYTLLVTTDLPLRPPRKPFYFPQNSLTYPPQVINNDLLPPPPPPKKKIVFILLLFFKLFFFLWNVVVLIVEIYVFEWNRW